MATKSGNRPQSIDPDIVADLIRQLTVEGPVGMLDISDVISPVYLVAQREAFALEVQSPAYVPATVFSTGEQTNPGANTVLADTGQLAAGTYDCLFYQGNASATQRYTIQHRDAANAVTLQDWPIFTPNTGGQTWMAFAYTVALNERLRMLNIPAVTGQSWSVIHAVIRT